MVEESGPFHVPRKSSGIQWYPDGTIYQGEFDAQGLRCSPKGFQINADGSVLEGQWEADKPEGLVTEYKRMDRRQEITEIKFSQGVPNGVGMLCRNQCNVVLTVRYEWGKKIDETLTERRQEDRALRIRKLIETRYLKAIKLFAQQKESPIRDVTQVGIEVHRPPPCLSYAPFVLSSTQTPSINRESRLMKGIISNSGPSSRPVGV